MQVPSWQADLPTITHPGNIEEWQETDIYFDKLLPAFGGGPSRQPKSTKQFQFASREMKEVGFMLSLRLSDGSPNPPATFGPPDSIFDFSLEIHSVTPIYK